MLNKFRSQHPAYSDLSDEQLSEALYAKFYSDMPKEEFMVKVMPQTLTDSGSTGQAPESLSGPLLGEGEGVDEGQVEQVQELKQILGDRDGILLG